MAARGKTVGETAGRPIKKIVDGQYQCTACGVWKPVDQFGRYDYSMSGLRQHCKSCRKEEGRLYNEQNPEKVKAAGAAQRGKYRKTNSCKTFDLLEVRHCKKCGLDKTRGEFRKNLNAKSGCATYCIPCEDSRLEQWREDNPEIMVSYRRRAYARNKDDPKFKIKCNLRVRLGSAVRDQLHREASDKVYRGASKRAGSAVRDLGCTVPELLQYLESLFQPGMTGEKYGEWHVDHILPLAAIDVFNREDIKRVCHYTNLQPLWAADNIRKGDKLPDSVP